MSDPARPTFAGLPAGRTDALDGARVVLLGASEASPYVPGEPSHSADAPAAIRLASRQFARQLDQLDFDLEDTLLPEAGATRGLVDAGDVATDANDAEGNRARIADAVRAVLDAGAVPVVLGGDDGVPIPMLQAYADHGPVTVVQVDAHVDWGDTIRGNRFGYGSPMRRVAEMPWVTGMIQLGVRGLGSGQAWQIADARGWGSRIVPSRELRAIGMAAALETLPEGGAVVVAIDCDGIDPAAFPAVAMPTPGGPGYDDLVDMLHHIARRGRLAGLVLTEYVPERDDPHHLCALTAARLVAVAMGLALR